MIHPFVRILSTLALLFTGALVAQNVTYPIHIHNGQTIETCSGLFVDSGQDTLTAYSNLENYQITFTAPENEGTPQFIRLNFLFFELGAGDYMYIYDGEDNNASLLATGSGTSLRNQQFWSSGTSLHIRFESSASDAGLGWLALVGCFERCDAFFTDISTHTGSFDFCPDTQLVTFTAQAGYRNNPTDSSPGDLTFQWIFDGIPMEGSEVTHNYNGPGAYPFRLRISDSQHNCAIDTIITVRLATIPELSYTVSPLDTICSGETFTLIGNAQPVAWTGFPTRVDTIAFINPSNPFTSSLTFDVFPDGEQIVLISDFDRVCIEMEHEDFGDVKFELTCPNATSILLKDFSLGGANLGEPVIFGPQDLHGKGYEYCFRTDARFGNMNDKAFEFHSYTDRFGDLYNNQPFLPGGSYTPEESFTALVGCPLNGTWTLTAQDQETTNSGHILGWSLYFNDDFYPDSLIFSPEIIEEKWFDKNGNDLGANPANVSVTEDGKHQFTFRALDNFGCSWDTTLTVLILPLPKATIVSDLEIPVCEGDSTLLRIEADLAGDEFHWIYQWMLEGAELPNRIFDTIMAKEVATYMVRITDTLTGCADFFDLLISNQNCDLRIPNVFTPNGDTMNDFFEIENLENYDSSVMVIYNRNGKKVFESNDYYLNWWDGGNHPDGTYYYVLSYTRLGKKKQAHGIITILR
jgi:gliding motility-associated-like protein